MFLVNENPCRFYEISFAASRYLHIHSSKGDVRDLRRVEILMVKIMKISEQEILMKVLSSVEAKNFNIFW